MFNLIINGTVRVMGGQLAAVRRVVLYLYVCNRTHDTGQNPALKIPANHQKEIASGPLEVQYWCYI